MGLEKSFRGKCSSSAVFLPTSVICFPDCFPHLASCIYFLALDNRYVFPALVTRYLFPALGIWWLFPFSRALHPLGTRDLFPTRSLPPAIYFPHLVTVTLFSLLAPAIYFPRLAPTSAAWQDVYSSARSYCFISQAERLLDEAVQKYPDFAKVRVTNNFE